MIGLFWNSANHLRNRENSDFCSQIEQTRIIHHHQVQKLISLSQVL